MVTKEEVFSNLTIKQDAGVPFNRTNPVPLDKHSIFASKDDAVSYATLSATAYPGQVIAVNEDELTPWAAECEQLTTAVPSFELSFENTTWKVSFSNGYTTTAGMGGWKKYDVETSSWITSDFTANDLSLCLPDQEGNLMIPMTSSETPVSVYFSRTEVNTWNLYVLDASAPNNLKKIEGGGGGGGGGGGDVEAETARAKAVEQALSGAIDENTSDITSISGIVDNLSNALTALSDGLSDYLPLSGGTLTGDTTVDSNLSVSGDLSVGEAQFNDGDATGLTITKDDESYQFGGTESENQVARKSDLSVYVLSSQLSDAMAGNLSSANAANPVMLSSDLSALLSSAIVLKGSASTSAALPSADVHIGDMYIITGDSEEAGTEWVCVKLTGDGHDEPDWEPLGRDGTTRALWDAIGTLSNTTIPTLCTGLSTAISANTTSITAISDVIENGISAAIEDITADIDTLSNTTIPTLCTDLSNAITDITSDIDGISTDIYGDGETSGLSGKVDDLTTNVGTISTDIYDETNGLSVQVSALKDDVDSLESSLTAVSSDLTAVSADLTAVSSAVSALQEANVSVNIDNVSSDQLNVLHISEADYHQLVVDGDIDPKTIYIVSADGYQNMYGERITNLSTLSTDLSSAANVSFVTAYVGDQMATVNGDVEYLSNAITTITADITAITSDIDYVSGQIDSLSGAMVSAVVISAETRAISADVTNGVATISGLSVSDLAWDISVINGGDSGYVPQTEEPVEP